MNENDKEILTEMIITKMMMALTGITETSQPESDKCVAETISALSNALLNIDACNVAIEEDIIAGCAEEGESGDGSLRT